MYLILYVLDNPDSLNEVLNAWENIGIRGITILPSTGLGRIRSKFGLQDDFPIFPSIRDLLDHEQDTNRTLFTVIDEELLEPVVAATEGVVGDLTGPNTGILVALPVARVFGGMRSHKPGE